MANQNFPIVEMTQGEFRADVTRDTFSPLDCFRRVIAQQGRPMLDADANEQTAILLHYLECLAQDLGGPVFGRGFEVGVRSVEGSGAFEDLTIGPGRLYVQGMLVENPDEVAYAEQPFDPHGDSFQAAATQRYLLYLDTWERHVTYRQRPYLREVALGGPDTATRSQVVWQVRGLPIEPEVELTNYKEFLEQLARTGVTRPGGVLMRAGTNPTSSERESPCVTSPLASYRGPENQLYRVEVHGRGEPGELTFKWSRDNSSVQFSVTAIHAEVVTLASLGRDDQTSIAEGDWVELVDDGEVPSRPARPLLRVLRVDRERMQVTLEGTPADVQIDRISTGHIHLRRWDQRTSDGLVHARYTKSGRAWVELEAKIRVEFSLAESAEEGEVEDLPQPGDYWLVPARVATGKVEWPAAASGDHKAGIPLAPRGTLHRYAPLGVLQQQDGQWQVAPVPELRK